MKEITQRPFRKGSILNFLFEARMKRDLTQTEVAKLIRRSHASFSDYENGTRIIPNELVAIIPELLWFEPKEVRDFKKFVKAVDRKKTERGVVKTKSHASFVRAGVRRFLKTKKDLKRKQAVKKVKVKKVSRKRVLGLSAEEKKVLKFMTGFLFKRKGKEALNLLLRMIKTIRK